MSKDNDKKITVKFEFPQIVNETLKPLATSIGNTLSYGWDGMTMGIATWYGKKKIEHDKNLELYKNEIQKNLETIPEENLQEPKMNILGPALEASKFYFEEEQYREMFSKLVTGSFDNRNNEKIHPFFVEAIKQMTSREAKLLSFFKNKTILPIARYKYRFSRGSKTLFEYVFYPDNQYVDPQYYSTSLVNLERLGLISIKLDEFLTDDSEYNVFRDDPQFIMCKSHVANASSENSDIKDFDFEKGVVSLTPLGKNFIDICV